MYQFELTPDLQTEVEGIDELHRNLLLFANRAAAANSEHLGPEGLRAALQELVDCVQHVFATEEQWMQSIGYPALSGHRQSHNEIRLEICELVDAVRKPDALTKVQALLSRAIGTLLLDHFRTHDQTLASHARQHLKPHQIHLSESATLMRAGVIVPDGIEEAERITGTDFAH